MEGVNRRELKLMVPSFWDYLDTAPGALRRDARDLLKKRTRHLSIDRTAQQRKLIENHLVETFAQPQHRDTAGLLLFTKTPAGRPLPASGVIKHTSVDLRDERACHGLVEIEAKDALVADILPIHNVSAVVSIREPKRTEDTSQWNNDEGRKFLAGIQAYYQLTGNNFIADTTSYRMREVSVWLPVPGVAHTMLLHFVLPIGEYTDTLTEICFMTAASATFRDITGAPHTAEPGAMPKPEAPVGQQ